MTDQPDLRAAVAAGVVGSEESFRALLGAIVEVARSIFGAKASSILLLDAETEELVFEAVVGEGEDTLLGTRFPAGTGIAGWVLATRTPLVIEDVQNDPRFASDVAEDTGYVPKGLMAAPLLHEEGALGVLSVLDRPEQTLFSLQEMELLGLFANQAAIAVDLLLKAREAERLLGEGGGELEVVARLATAVDALEDEQREAGFRLLEPPRKNARRVAKREARLPGPLESCGIVSLLFGGRSLGKRALCGGTLCERALGERAVSLEVGLVFGRLGRGAFGGRGPQLLGPLQMGREPRPRPLGVSSRPTSRAPPVRALDARFCRTRQRSRGKSSLAVFHSASPGEMLRAVGGIWQRFRDSLGCVRDPFGATPTCAGSSSRGPHRSSASTRSWSLSRSTPTASAARRRSA